MLRVFAADCSPQANGQTLQLEGDEAHHLLKVRRARLGATVQVLNGRGLRALGEITAATPRAATITLHTLGSAPPPPAAITLAQAIPAAGTMDTIVQKATELGASRIVPLFTRNCEVRLDPSRADHKTAKWRAIAIEACKQCGNPWLPDIASPLPLKTYLEQETAPLRLTAALTPATQEIRQALRLLPSPPPPIALTIGPEGDFSPEEYQSLWHHHWLPITLGPNTLRADTAAISALALLLHELRTLP